VEEGVMKEVVRGEDEEGLVRAASDRRIP